ncbi:superoxide dismutase [Niveispirillum sp. KHB5.9]|uniref:superoxide dismutase n=1 Tax=Niveispirillum sp. KHB5.9 TaxID=3400269 RepID=UPI003A8A3445
MPRQAATAQAITPRIGLDRRTLLFTGGAALAVGLCSCPVFAQAPAAGPHMLPSLPYAASALEPHISGQIMELHHTKHHQAYVTKLNQALADHGQLQSLSLPELLVEFPKLPETVRKAVRDNGGGHANHSMFWSIMGPNGGGAPKGAVARAIDEAYGSFDSFKKSFNETGAKQFGSGWVFVTVNVKGRLSIAPRPNQDTPIMDGEHVLMGNDVWEHAYYLQYQNRRDEYLQAWWNVVDWQAVNDRYARIRKAERII